MSITNEVQTPQRLAPSTDEAFKQIVKIIRNVDKCLFLYAFNIQSTMHLRTLSKHGVEHTFAEDLRCLLFYETGWIGNGSGKRTFSKVFLLSDTTWLVQTYETGSRRDPTLERCNTRDLLSVLQELNFHGPAAHRSIRRLLKAIQPRSKWSSSWEILCW